MKAMHRGWLMLALLSATTLAYCGGRSLGNNASDSGILGTDSSNRPPEVTTITPANNATGANRDVAINVTFNVFINVSTVTVTSNTTCTGSFQLSTDPGFATCVPLNSTVVSSGSTITVRSTNLLTASALHYVRITTAVAGPSGVAMQTTYNSQFTTGTGITPLSNEFGTDCSAGGNTIGQVKAPMTATEAAIGPFTVNQLIVTGIESSGKFHVQKGTEALFVDVSTSGTGCGGSGCQGNRASQYGLQVGDEICLTVSRGQSNFSVPTVRDFSAIKKTSIGSVTLMNVNVAGLPVLADISRRATVTGFISSKGGSGNVDHQLTFGGSTIVLRDWSSAKFSSFAVGDYVTVESNLSWFSGAPQFTFDTAIGNISSAGTPAAYSVTGTVSGWATGENFSITLNGANATTISANGAFSFTGSPTVTGQYTVAISANPATYQCTITNGSGFSTTNVTNVTVTCAPPPLYSMVSFNAGDLLSSQSITVRCTPSNSTGAGLGQDDDAPLAGVPTGSYSGVTSLNTQTTSFGVLGLGTDGISLLNTGTANASCAGGAASGFISALDIPVDTTGKSDITVSYLVGQHQNQTREWGLRLQYSTNGGGAFTDLNPVGDFDSTSAGTVEYTTTKYSYGPFLLPAAANNNPNLIIRWRYYGLSDSTGSRTRIVLDDIYVRAAGQTDSTAPTVGSLTMNGTGTQAALTWTAGSDNLNAAANIVYRVYRHTSSFTAPGTGTLVYTSLPGQTAYTNTGLTEGSTYYYRLLAVDTQGNVSAQSNEVSYTAVDTTAPTVSSASPTSGASGIALSTSVSLTFSEGMHVANTQGAYTIKETDCSGTTVSVGSPTPSGGNTIFTYTLSNLKPSQVYAHCVTTSATDDATPTHNAIAAAYSSTWTTAALAEPTSPTYTAGDTTVTLGWTNSSNANAGVKIVRSTGSAPADCSSGTIVCDAATNTPTATGCNANVTTGAAGLNFADTTVSNGTTYYYRICSRHNSGAYLSAGVTGSATPTNAFNVNSASSTGNTTVTVTFSAAPNSTEAQTAGNYEIVLAASACGSGGVLSVSSPSLSSNVVTLTTAAQTGSTNYKICVSNVTRNGDGVPLTTSSATFTGTAGGHLVISQVYGGGGNAGATYIQDFIEIFNPTAGALSLNGLFLQYTSATGNFSNTGSNNYTFPNVSVPAYSYYLIRCAAGAGGTVNVPGDQTGCTLALSGTAGKVALVNSLLNLEKPAVLPDSRVIDYVGFGGTADKFEGAGPAPAPSNTNSVIRGSGGCTDTDANSTNFTAATAYPNARNSGSATNVCP